jgi:hypothetical protein
MRSHQGSHSLSTWLNAIIIRPDCESDILGAFDPLLNILSYQLASAWITSSCTIERPDLLLASLLILLFIERSSSASP